MTKIESFRRFFLPCIHPGGSPSPTPPPPKVTISRKRLSASLREDLDDAEPKKQEHSDPSTPTAALALSVPPRASRTMVIGTIFGLRRGGHVWLCFQQDRLCTRPSLLLELSIPTTTLIQEMKCEIVRIALESKEEGAESGPSPSRVHLHSVPIWTLFCNGRKLGFAVRRNASPKNRLMLKTMQNVTVGAGVLPAEFGPGQDSEELMYMRANYECVVGNADSESFHLINPDEGLGQELSIFLMRSR